MGSLSDAFPTSFGGASDSGFFDPLDISGSQASQKATAAQVEASQASIAELRRQFDIQQEQIAPFREAALPALSQLTQLSGAGGLQQQQSAFDTFAASPGQQFLRRAGEKNLLKSASAIGGVGGEQVRSALDQQAAGLAAQDFGSQLNRLAGLAGIAQTAGQQQAGASQQFATGIQGQLSRQAQAITAGEQAGQAGRAQLAGQGANVLGQVLG